MSHKRPSAENVALSIKVITIAIIFVPVFPWLWMVVKLEFYLG